MHSVNKGHQHHWSYAISLLDNSSCVILMHVHIRDGFYAKLWFWVVLKYLNYPDKCIKFNLIPTEISVNNQSHLLNWKWEILIHPYIFMRGTFSLKGEYMDKSDRNPIFGYPDPSLLHIAIHTYSTMQYLWVCLMPYIKSQEGNESTK